MIYFLQSSKFKKFLIIIILQNLFHFSSTFLSWCRPCSVWQPEPMTEGFGHGVVQDGWLAPSIAPDRSGALWQSSNDFQVGNFSQSLSIKPPASGSGTFVMTDEYIYFFLTWRAELPLIYSSSGHYEATFTWTRRPLLECKHLLIHELLLNLLKLGQSYFNYHTCKAKAHRPLCITSFFPYSFEFSAEERPHCLWMHHCVLFKKMDAVCYCSPAVCLKGDVDWWKVSCSSEGMVQCWFTPIHSIPWSLVVFILLFIEDTTQPNNKKSPGRYSISVSQFIF